MALPLALLGIGAAGNAAKSLFQKRGMTGDEMVEFLRRSADRLSPANPIDRMGLLQTAKARSRRGAVAGARAFDTAGGVGRRSSARPFAFGQLQRQGARDVNRASIDINKLFGDFEFKRKEAGLRAASGVLPSAVRRSGQIHPALAALGDLIGGGGDIAQMQGLMKMLGMDKQ